VSEKIIIYARFLIDVFVDFLSCYLAWWLDKKVFTVRVIIDCSEESMIFFTSISSDDQNKTLTLF
jgi:hypothetical protein